MSISAITSGQTGTGTQSGTREAKNTLGKEDFMLLLVTQLQHQDPLNPMDSADFTAQLAQFSSLEQLSQVNTHLQSLQESQASQTNTLATGLIGKYVKAQGNTVSVEAGTATPVTFDLSGDAAKIFVAVYDASGNLVTRIQKGAMAAGEQSITWNGKSDSGTTVPDGVYQFEIAATDVEGNAVGTGSYVRARIDGVTISNGKTMLMAGQRVFGLESVISVTEDPVTTN